mmetsp:Transcript_21691/g.64620  ORF Transcript_21691/g.64620 Transcript_21691/m.64620 type:complete len:208 (-) Transcript_21691:479-1102(-)
MNAVSANPHRHEKADFQTEVEHEINKTAGCRCPLLQQLASGGNKREPRCLFAFHGELPHRLNLAQNLDRRRCGELIDDRLPRIQTARKLIDIPLQNAKGHQWNYSCGEHNRRRLVKHDPQGHYHCEETLQNDRRVLYNAFADLLGVFGQSCLHDTSRRPIEELVILMQQALHNPLRDTATQLGAHALCVRLTNHLDDLMKELTRCDL